MVKRTRNPIREILANLLLLACGLAFLFIFLSIMILGSYSAIEPTPWILYAELVMSVGIAGLGIERLIDNLRHMEMKSRG